MIEIAGVTWTYPGASEPALCDLNLQIAQGSSSFCAAPADRESRRRCAS